MNRRLFFLSSTALITSTMALRGGLSMAYAKTMEYPLKAGDMVYEINKSDAEWKAFLTQIQFDVLREEETEQKDSSPLNNEKRVGIFHCTGCDLPAYSSDTKYNSNTGWPSFYDNIENAVRTKEDNSFFSTRTEVHCRRCGGHFGHIFEDGPEPTGLRHCLNGVALTFKAKTT